MTVTAYTEHEASCEKTPDHPAYGITASGTKVQANRTIAAPDHIEFGTPVYIDGHRYVVEDRGGDITEGRIDIYMPTEEAAYKFGRQKKQVLIETGGFWH